MANSKIETDSNDNIILELASGETVTVKASDVEFDQDLVPKTDSDGNVGTPSKSWGDANIDRATIGGVKTSRDTDVVFYVDQANGDDDNGGQSASDAFASYPRALEELPRFGDAQVQIRQIGDYSTPTNTPLKITNRSGAIYQDGEFSLEILGDSELGAVGDDDPAGMEQFDGNIHIEGVSGVNIKFLEFDGMPWVTSSIGITFYSCYMYGSNYAFAYLRSGEINLVYNIYDGQVNDPNIGFSCLRNGRMQVEGGEIRNWDYQNNVAYQAFNGGKIIDDFDDKYPDANRTGDIVPSDGRGISDEAFDRDLDGKDLTDGSNTVYSGANGYVPQAILERDSLTVNANDGLTGGGTVSLGSTAVINVDPAQFAGALLSEDGSNNLTVDESNIDHDEIDQSTVTANDHHARDHATRHGFDDSDELTTALRYEPEAEPSAPDNGVVRWYDESTDAFMAKFDDGATIVLAEK